MATEFPAQLPHGPIEEIFPDVFQVNGTIAMKPIFRFDRNMTIVRQNGELTLINTVRLDEAGLAKLDELGQVKHVMRLGFFHDRDDPFYVDRYGAKMWALPGHEHALELQADVEMSADTELPLADASLFVFETTSKPEAILRLDAEGGILIPCDSLQNWEKPNQYFNFVSKLLMRMMGFLKPTNVGPGWIKFTKPGASDFERLNALSYKHVLPAHGTPVKNTAHADYAAAFERLFGVKAS